MSNELSLLAKEVEKRKLMIRVGASEEEKAIIRIVRIFNAHLLQLINSLKSYRINKTNHIRIISGYIQGMRNDCDILIQQVRNDKLNELVSKVLEITNNIDQGLRSRLNYPNNEAFMQLLRQEINKLVEYYNKVKLSSLTAEASC